MISEQYYSPIYALTRSEVVESMHMGAVAVVDVFGSLLGWYGDPNAFTFLRSSAKPFQVLPFLTHGGKQNYNLTDKEVAILCASHSGTDAHVDTIRQIQLKTGVHEEDLLCGVHDPLHQPTAAILRERKEIPTPNRHNCSGKHTGMLAFARMLQVEMKSIDEDLAYIDPAHPVQQEILAAFAEMCGLPVDQIALGVDGCSAPIFAAPLYNVALAYARLCDPEVGGVQPEARIQACRQIVQAMVGNPLMVAGPERFDSQLMEAGGGRILAKGGAEAYMGVGLMPGVLSPSSPAVGIAIKIGDGDRRSIVRAAVTLEVLRQLEALSPSELEALSVFGPHLPVKNWRDLAVGEAYPIFELNRKSSKVR